MIKLRKCHILFADNAQTGGEVLLSMLIRYRLHANKKSPEFPPWGFCDDHETATFLPSFIYFDSGRV
jgi:hypothetical protein